VHDTSRICSRSYPFFNPRERLQSHDFFNELRKWICKQSYGDASIDEFSDSKKKSSRMDLISAYETFVRNSSIFSRNFVKVQMEHGKDQEPEVEL
jgi:Tfp pilus assembly protein PilV